jgi:hypothetical protein
VLGQGSLTRAGYTFGGWNTAADGSGTPYAAGASFVLSANTTLYAQYLPTYTVTYSANGGTGTAPIDPGGPHLSGSSITVLGNTGNLTKPNNVFNSWNTVASGVGGIAYAQGSTVIIGNTDITLYAQWTTSTKLGTPQPAWTGATDPKPLSFAVTNATGYLVSSCSTTNNALTSCVPASPASQATLSVYANPPNKATYCYSVVAIGPSPYTNSDASGTFCLHALGSAYTYSP